MAIFIKVNIRFWLKKLNFYVYFQLKFSQTGYAFLTTSGLTSPASPLSVIGEVTALSWSNLMSIGVTS